MKESPTIYCGAFLWNGLQIREDTKMNIPVVFSTDRNYLIPLQVALCSLIKNRAVNTEYDIYILHSDDLTEKDFVRLETLVEEEQGNKLHFVSMGDMYREIVIDNPVWTMATFYRLSIHKVIPDIYDCCIYCDTDILINCDLQNLFQIDIGEYYLAGLMDSVICYSRFRDLFPYLNKYINAVVLCIKLKKCREIHIENQFEKHLLQKYRYADQDILNLVCRDKILLLEDDKYVLSGILNKKKYPETRQTIIHYCGLVKPWDIAMENPFYKLWVFYARQSLISMEKLRLEEKRKKVQSYIDKLDIRKVIVWGMAASTLDICFFWEEWGINVIAIGDNNKEKVKMGNPYYKMMDGNGVEENLDCYYIVVTSKYYEEIKTQLMRFGVLDAKIINWFEFKRMMVIA